MSELISKFTALQNRKDPDKALTMLQKIASLVKPIMRCALLTDRVVDAQTLSRKHSFKVPVLSEFFPENPGLLGLNVNKGQKILVRLRPSFDPDTFLELEDVVQTMLHELTHNVHGPHDEKFYKFLSGLQEEYDALERSGYAGEGFFSAGKRVGENVSHNVPQHLARSKVLEAAQKRQQTSQVLGGGGRRLGGSITSELSRRELAAKAAERRIRDEKSCEQGDLAQEEADKATKDSIEKTVVDLTGDDITVPIPNTVKPKERQPPRPKPLKSSSSSPGWQCPQCTLLNHQNTLQCDACLAVRPGETWFCLHCGETGISNEFWSCRLCGQIKVSS
ncbi:WLM domain-containing protein [Mycena floridula]|nr:WLM domain-containing protein [Mycena floridula]